MSDIIIRASSTTGWMDCQLRAAAQSAPALFAEHGWSLAPPRSNIGALVGSGVHGAAEPALTERMLSGTVMPVDAIEDAGIEAFRARRADEAETVAEIVMDSDSPSMDDAERQIRRMARQYRVDVLQESEPVAVESRITAQFMPGVILSGQADLLHLDATSRIVREWERGRLPDAVHTDDQGRHIVRDLKTSRKKVVAITHAAQIGSYSLLFRSMGYDTGGGQIDSLPRASMKKLVQPPVEPIPLDIFAAEQIAHAVLTDMGGKLLAFAADGNPSRFLPNPSSNLCSYRFCRAFGTAACPATRSL